MRIGAWSTYVSGKSCVVFKRLDEVPLDVLGETVARIPVGEFIARNEDSRTR